MADDLETQAKFIYDSITIRLSRMFKSYREKKGYSLRQLNKITGVCIGVISNLETGKNLPKFDILLRLALALDIGLDDLLSEMNMAKKNSVSLPQPCIRPSFVRDLTIEEFRQIIRDELCTNSSYNLDTGVALPIVGHHIHISRREQDSSEPYC